ncbi:MAG: hypothetical protein KL787_03375 [Taibaiella sp.]|nr:hypothetical protein [Taibaiella sp.]
MINNASKFIRKRGVDIIAITANRIDAIVWYVSECYQLICKDNPKYQIDRKNSKIKFEDYLRFRLVDDYLRKNKCLIASKYPELAEINFHCEEQTEYYDINKKEKNADKIDITVNRLALQEAWNDTDENIYFAIECKRIKVLSDCEAYTIDTEKFANRSYLNTRLPLEGQLAFIESGKLNHNSVSTEINKRLPSRTTLTTKQLLINTSKHSSFNGCYQSIHKRNYNKKEDFEVLHLLFDYSSFVVE